jgi:hypothetical protein
VARIDTKKGYDQTGEGSRILRQHSIDGDILAGPNRAPKALIVAFARQQFPQCGKPRCALEGENDAEYRIIPDHILQLPRVYKMHEAFIDRYAAT